MKKGLTELVFILDRSGSMADLTQDTVGGYNAFLERQKAAPGEALVSTVLFSNTSTVIHDRVPLSRVEPMTLKQYQVFGSTALMDAMGDAIHHIATIHKYAREEDVPENTVFVIITDGMENASRHWNLNDVQALITKQKNEKGWEFLFLAANIDAVRTASHFGIAPDRAVTYTADAQGTRLNYRVVSDAVAQMRESMPLAANWKEDIEEDHRNRKPRR